MNTEIPNRILIPVKPGLSIKDRLDLWKATRLGGVGEKGPRASLITRLASIPALGAVIIGACGGATSEPPTTSTTVIESTTTEATTTLPTTSTTEATTTTTGAETTTTIPPDCTIPSGRVNIDGEDVPLGLFKDPLHTYQEGEESISVRVLNAYTKLYRDFRGEDAVVVYLDVCVGHYSNGSPIIVSVMFGRSDIDYINTTFYNTSNDITSGLITTDLYARMSDILPLLEERETNSSQIGFIINTLTSSESDLSEDNFNSCVEYFNGQQINGQSYCDLAWEKAEHIETNVKLLDLLRQGSIDSNQGLSENEVIVVKNILLFKP